MQPMRREPALLHDACRRRATDRECHETYICIICQHVCFVKQFYVLRRPYNSIARCGNAA